jgi:uncharacterized protein YndB with AHSA1/START domain
MFQVQHTVIIPRAPERVWGTFEDLTAWPKWCAVIQAARWITESQWRRGARFSVTFRLGNRRTSIHAEVLSVEPARRLVWLAHRPGTTSRHTFTFEAEGMGTRVTSTQVFTGPLLFLTRLLLPPACIRAITVRWLEALKAEAQR